MNKQLKKARIGIYSTGLSTYWEQFEGLRERLIGYGQHIEKKVSQWADVYNFGLVDSVEKGREAGEYFNQHQVDIILLHVATYSTSATILPIHQRCDAKVIILNLQPTERVDYNQATTGEWLAYCGACPVPEFCNALSRAEIPYKVVSGLLGLEDVPNKSAEQEFSYKRPEAERAWKLIREWVKAATVKASLSDSRFGFLGNTYSGMLDLYSDFTMIQAQTGIHVEVLEMCDLDEELNNVTEDEIQHIRHEINNMFIISEDSSTEQLAKKPSNEQLNWSAKVAAAQEKMISSRHLSALTYYYHGNQNNHYEQLQSGFTVGHSLLTAQHVPCAGEGDLKTNIAMKICDILNVGGSFCEIVTTDYIDGTILFGHDGPFHLEIAEGKPILRGMELYHGKKGSGIAVEAKVKTGEVTMLGLTQSANGKLKLIISEGISTDGPTMQIGNTQTPVKFEITPDHYYEKWFAEAPTHHCAMSIGHNGKLMEKVGYLMDIETVII